MLVGGRLRMIKFGLLWNGSDTPTLQHNLQCPTTEESDMLAIKNETRRKPCRSFCEHQKPANDFCADP